MKDEIDRDKIRKTIEQSEQFNAMKECDSIQIGTRFINIAEGDDLLGTLTDICIEQAMQSEENEKGVTVIENDHPDLTKEMEELSDLNDKDLL